MQGRAVFYIFFRENHPTCPNPRVREKATSHPQRIGLKKITPISGVEEMGDTKTERRQVREILLNDEILEGV